jgi:hypothetical protein
LHEGIGVIEIHTTSMPSDGGNHTMGIENADGTAATYVTGRLASNWSTSNEGIQFIPPNNTADDCGLAFTEQIAGLGFSAYFGVGTTTETYEITDLAGNQQTCSFTVTVVDNQAPFVATCPANITQVSNEPDCGGRVVNYTQQFGDNCHGYVSGSLVSGLASGSVFPIGTTPVSWTFDDGNGNPPATCSFNVTITEPTVLSSELNLSNGCASCSVSDGQTRTFYDQNGHYLMTLQDDLALPSALGNTTVCNLASAAPTADDELGDPVPVLGRFWSSGFDGSFYGLRVRRHAHASRCNGYLCHQQSGRRLLYALPERNGSGLCSAWRASRAGPEHNRQWRRHLFRGFRHGWL